MDTRPRLLPLRAMAGRLRVTATWLRREAEENGLPHVKADRQLLFDPELVEGILQDRAQQPQREATSG